MKMYEFVHIWLFTYLYVCLPEEATFFNIFINLFINSGTGYPDCSRHNL